MMAAHKIYLHPDDFITRCISMKEILKTFELKSKVFIFVYVLILALARSIFQSILSSSGTFTHLVNIQFLTVSLLLLFIFLMIKILIPEIKDVERVILPAFWLVIFTFPLNHVYLTLLSSPGIPYLETNFGVFVFAVLFTLYTGKMIKEKSVSQSSSFSTASLIILFFSIFLFAVAIFNQPQLLSFFAYQPGSTYFLVSLTLILLFEVVLLFSITARFYDKEAFISLVKSVKPFRTMHFVGLTFIGFMVAYRLNGNTLLDLSILIPAACMVLTWQFSTMINDFYDIDTDELVHPNRPLVKEKIDPKTFKQMGVLCALLSLLLSTLFSVELFLVNSVFVLAGAAYSIPPIRLKNRIFGHICVGYASVTAFLFGVYGTFALKEVDLFLTIETSKVPFFPDIFSFSILIFFVFSLSPLINAVDDFEGDKEAGVKNIYTVYGFEKGKKMVAVLIVILFLSPLLIFQDIIDILMILPASLISSFIFYKFENYKFVLGLYFIILLYILIRFLGL